jgi:hypothetical protein
MNKNELLSAVETGAREGTVTRGEILKAYDRGEPEGRDSVLHALSLSEILYYIGGAIVFLGIAVLIWQNWEFLPDLTKILATFGSGIAAYVAGVLLMGYPKLEKPSMAMFFLSAIVLPLGLLVTFDVAGFDMNSSAVYSIISGVLTGVFLLSFAIFRKNIFLLFTIIYATWLFFAFTDLLVGSAPLFEEWRFVMYRFLAAGFAYLALGYHFQHNRNGEFVSFLYGFGTLGVLGSALALGGWSPDNYPFWQIIYPGLVFGAIFLSIYVKSRSFLVFGSMFLMIYIIKITAEYFTNSIGWPLSLVLAGLMLMVVGYATVSLNRKYLKNS